MNAKKILIVDDDGSVLAAAKLLVECIMEDAHFAKEKGEFVIHTASNMFDAVDLIELHEFDVVLSDFRIPNPGRSLFDGIHREGATIAREARRKSETAGIDTFVIVMSGDITVADRNSTPAHAFLVKPFDMNELKELIVPHVSKAHAAH